MVQDLTSKVLSTSVALGLLRTTFDLTQSYAYRLQSNAEMLQQQFGTAGYDILHIGIPGVTLLMGLTLTGIGAYCTYQYLKD